MSVSDLEARPLGRGPHAHCPADQLYWAQLDASRVPGRIRRDQLSYLLEPLVPQPLDELHAIYQPLPGRQYLAVAVAKEKLAAACGPEMVTLTPAALPEFVQDEVHPDQLNLLTGPFTPAAIRRVRRRWLQCAALLIVVTCALVTWGFERRIRVEREARRVVAATNHAVYEQVLGPAFVRSPLPPDLQLESELRRLRRTRATDRAQQSFADISPADAALSLSKVLRRWPDLYVQLESMHITSDAIHLQALVPDNRQAQALSSAFADLPGWQLDHPTVRSATVAVRVTLRLKRLPEPAS
jgi:hypothetical protein